MNYLQKILADSVRLWSAIFTRNTAPSFLETTQPTILKDTREQIAPLQKREKRLTDQLEISGKRIEPLESVDGIQKQIENFQNGGTNQKREIEETEVFFSPFVSHKEIGRLPEQKEGTTSLLWNPVVLPSSSPSVEGEEEQSMQRPSLKRQTEEEFSFESNGGNIWEMAVQEMLAPLFFAAVQRKYAMDTWDTEKEEDILFFDSMRETKILEQEQEPSTYSAHSEVFSNTMGAQWLYESMKQTESNPFSLAEKQNSPVMENIYENNLTEQMSQYLEQDARRYDHAAIFY